MQTHNTTHANTQHTQQHRQANTNTQHNTGRHTHNTGKHTHNKHRKQRQLLRCVGCGKATSNYFSFTLHPTPHQGRKHWRDASFCAMACFQKFFTILATESWWHFMHLWSLICFGIFCRIMIVRMISVSGISGSLSILPTIDAAGRSMCTLNLWS